MATSCGIVAAAQSQLVSNQWDAPASLPTFDCFRVRASCANSGSSSPSSFAGFASELLTCSRQDLRKHGRVFHQTRRRNRVQVAAEEGEGEEPREAVSERWSLDDLDQQLKGLSSRETSAPRRIPIPRQTLGTGDSDNQQNTVNGSGTKLQWPTLTTEFFVYAAIALLVLTVLNNVLYKVFLGAPSIDRKDPSKTTVPFTPRFRITSLQEEREAREAREAKDAQQAAIAAQSKEAPLPLE